MTTNKNNVPTNPDAFVNGIWDSDDENVYLEDIVQDDSPLDAVLTRSGRPGTNTRSTTTSSNQSIGHSSSHKAQ